MTATHVASQPTPKWFWVVSVGVLLFMLVGVAGYLASVMAPIDSMPPDRQLLMAAMPDWQVAVYAMAVWSGVAGALLLLMRRRWSVPILLLSLLCAIGTFVPYVLVPEVQALSTRGDGIAAIIVIGLCLASAGFARHSQRKGWLL
jgi:hypothetical protein